MKEFDYRFGFPVQGNNDIVLDLVTIGYNVSIDKIMFQKPKTSEMILSELEDIEIYI